MSRQGRIYLYSFLNAMSLLVVADFLFLDLFLLRIRAGVSTVGLIKSLTFFVPVIAYQVCVPLLERLRIDVPLCTWSYMLRVQLPLLLPLAALLGADGRLLSRLCVVILPLAVTLAAFANNALMMIYREQLPPPEFNRCVGNVQMLYRLPTLLLGIPLAKLFEFGSGGGDTRFYLVYLGALLLFGSFQFPAFAALSPLGGGARRCAKTSLSVLYRPYIDPGYRGVLLTSAFHAVVTGGGNAYVMIYCLKIMELPISHVYILRMGTLVAGMAALPFAGRLADRVGYRNTLAYAGALMALGVGLFVAFPHPWMLPLFALLCWDGTASPVGGAMLMCEQAAAARLAPENGLTGYLAAFNVAQGAGLFAGALGGGALFDLLLSAGGTDEAAAFRTVFCSWLPFLILAVYASRRWLKRERKAA